MNKAIIIGNLTRDPEVRTTSTGVTVCTFSVAVNRKTTNDEKIADFFSIVAWRQLGELCGKYLAKGRKVAIDGELQTRTYDAKDGTKRFITEIVARNIDFLTPRPQEDAESAATAGTPEGFTELPDDSELPF